MNNQGEKQQNSKDTSSVVVEKLLSSRITNHFGRDKSRVS